MPFPIFCSYRPFLFVIFDCSPALCVPRLVDACLQMKGWKLFLKAHLLVGNIRSDHSFFFSLYISPSIKFVIAQPRYIHSVMLKGMIPRWRQPRARGRAGLQVMRTECIVI